MNFSLDADASEGEKRAVGYVGFAGVMLIMIGIFDVIHGLVACSTTSSMLHTGLGVRARHHCMGPGGVRSHSLRYVSVPTECHSTSSRIDVPASLEFRSTGDPVLKRSAAIQVLDAGRPMSALNGNTMTLPVDRSIFAARGWPGKALQPSDRMSRS